MSATLVAKGLAAGHGDRVLFNGLDLVVAPGDVVGLVGANGAGKSTLLRTLAGLIPAEQGTVRLSPPNATVGHLPQEPDRRPGETVRAFLERRTGVGAAQVALDVAAEALGAGEKGAEDVYAEALERWLALGGADLGERPIFRTGDLSVDLVRRIVKVGEREIKLSPKEYDLLRVLVQHAGKVLTHRFLLKELWDELTDAQYLRVYVRQLRQKIEADPERPQFVLTETGIGYRLRAPD